MFKLKYEMRVIAQWFAITFALSFIIVLKALAYAGDGHYLPLSNSLLGKVFPQTCIVPELLDTDGLIVAGVNFRLSGTDKMGRNWNLELSPSAAGGSIWKADLDFNGQPDFIVLLNTGGCGIAPTSRLIFLMFDKNLTPSVSSITGYFSAQGNGIEDLRQLSGQKNATLIEQILAYNTASNKNFWRTTIWQSKSTKWISLRQFENVSLPTYTLYTEKPNHRISKLTHTPEVSEPGEAAICPFVSEQNGSLPCEKFTMTKADARRVHAHDGQYSLNGSTKYFSGGDELEEPQIDVHISGVGAKLATDVNQKVIITAVVQGTPAANANIQPGDEIIEVDSKPVKGQSFARVIEQIRGPINTQVSITFMRKSDTHKVTMRRVDYRHSRGH